MKWPYTCFKAANDFVNSPCILFYVVGRLPTVGRKHALWTPFTFAISRFYPLTHQRKRYAWMFGNRSARTYFVQRAGSCADFHEHGGRNHEDWATGQGPTDRNGPLGVDVHPVVPQLTVAVDTQGEHTLKWRKNKVNTMKKLFRKERSASVPLTKMVWGQVWAQLSIGAWPKVTTW